MLLCRLAENLFWMGRYLERAEDLSRAILAYEQSRLDIPGLKSHGWQRLSGLTGVESETASGHESSASIARVILDRHNPSALLGALHLARENLRKARFLLPSECWHSINPVYLRLQALDPTVSPAALGVILEQVVASIQELAGWFATSMLIDEGHAFLRVGIHLERADMILRVGTMLAETLIPDNDRSRFEDVRWMGLLKALGAYDAHRRRHHASADLGNTLEVLLVESTFPRSFAHSLVENGLALARLPGNTAPHAALRHCWPTEHVKTRAGLDRFAAEGLVNLAQLGSIIEATYFVSSTATGAQVAGPGTTPRETRGQPRHEVSRIVTNQQLRRHEPPLRAHPSTRRGTQSCSSRKTHPTMRR